MGCSSISLRGFAAIAALSALFCLAAASASAAPLVWTANWSGESVSTINSGTGHLVGSSIAVGKRPISVAITPNGKRAVVVNSEGESATVIETATRMPVETIPLSHKGNRVAISPDGTTAYVTDENDNEVHVIDPQTAKLVGSFPVGAEASEVALSPDGKLAYVGVAPKDIVTVDTATEEVVGEPIPVGGLPTSITFTPDGETAYITSEAVKAVSVIDTALAEVVEVIRTAEVPDNVAVSPDGDHLYIANATAGEVSVATTATNTMAPKAIPVPGGVKELALGPDGKTAWVAGGNTVTPINLVTEKPQAAISTGEVSALVVTPDQSPTAAFVAPSDVTVGIPASFSGSASTDPDGSVASYAWAFGDGGTATGLSATHTFKAPGTYNAKLSVVDNEGCGNEEIFTGRTAYCSGNPGATVIHPVAVRPSSVEPIATVTPSNRFRLGRIVHNRRNGTVRLQVKLPSAGFILLFGHKVHAVTRKSKGVQTMWLTIHARVRLAKRLKKVLRAPVRFRVTFTPNGGTARTVHRSVTLQRRPRHKH